VLYIFLIAFITISLLFVFSVTALLVISAWLVGAAVAFVLLSNKFSPRFAKSFICFIFPVLIMGLFFPLGLAAIDGVFDFVDGVNLFGKAGNWDTKISFTAMGNEVFYRFLPMEAFRAGTSHNLVFDNYLRLGYILLLPLLASIYGLSRRFLVHSNSYFSLAFSLVIFTHVFVVPNYFFSASGAISILSLASAAYYYRPQHNRVRQFP
jgi:hypothetical protein